MEENHTRVCRLCLKLFRNDFQAMEGVTREIFDVLLLKINFSISKEPVLCTNCAENLQKFFEFKTTCLYTEDRLVPLTSALDGSKVDLLEVAYMKENEDRNNENSEHKTICRFCMHLMAKDRCVAIDTLEEDFEKDIVRKCIPEMDLIITRKPVICTSCMEFLMGYYNFMMSCCDVEKNISDYCRSEHVDEGQTVNLEKVYSFVIRNTLTHGEFFDLVGVKTEQEEDDVEFVSDLTIKNEEIDIDLEQEPERTDPVSSSQTKKSPCSDKLQCTECIYITPHKHRLKRHMLTHKSLSEITTFNCDKCSHKFKFKESLKCHVFRVHPDHKATVYKCDKCAYSTINKSDLKAHMLRHATPSEADYFRCASCPYVTLRKSVLRVHVLTHLDCSKDKLVCESCTYSTNRKYRLVRHSAIHKDKDCSKDKFVCDRCTYSTNRKYRLVRHSAIHKEDAQVYKCHSCVYKTFVKHNFRKHLVRHNRSEDNQSVLKCNHCQYETRRKRYFVSHMNLHKSLEKVNFKCDKCCYEARSQEKLTRHNVTHTNKWQTETIRYQCYTCSFRTKSKPSLRYHIVVKHKSQGINMSLLEPSVRT